MNKNKINLTNVFLVIALLIANSAIASDKKFLTVDELIKNGYSQLSGLQLGALLKERKVEVRDIETEAVSVSVSTGSSDETSTRVSTDIKEEKPLYFLDTRLLARAPSLEGKPKYTVSEDELVATDGLRTYRIKFYEKQGKMYGARDIDNGNVFFEIVVK